MSHQLRGVDVAVTVVVLVAAAGVGAALVSTVTTDSQQARCAANLSKFGEALACYEARWGVYPPSDPWPIMPACWYPDGSEGTLPDCRNQTDPSLFFDPHTGAFYTNWAMCRA